MNNIFAAKSNVEHLLEPGAALCASVYMSTLGKAGMQEVALLNVRKSHYVADRVAKGSLSLPFSSPFFNEFAVKAPEGTNVKEINSKLLVAGYIGGYDLGAVP